jgi:hypothetical protein
VAFQRGSPRSRTGPSRRGADARAGLRHSRVGPLGAWIVQRPSTSRHSTGDFPSGRIATPRADVRALAGLATAWSDEIYRPARPAIEAGRKPGRTRSVAARTALTHSGPPRRVDERNPFKGLRAFTEADARDFSGGDRPRLSPAWEAGPSSSCRRRPAGRGSPRWSAGLSQRSVEGPGGRRIPSSPRCSRGPPMEELEAALPDRGAAGPGWASSGFRPGPARCRRSPRARRGEIVLGVDQLRRPSRRSDELSGAVPGVASRVESPTREQAPGDRDRATSTALIYPASGAARATDRGGPLTPDELEQAICAGRRGRRRPSRAGGGDDRRRGTSARRAPPPVRTHGALRAPRGRPPDLASYQDIGGLGLLRPSHRIYEATDAWPTPPGRSSCGWSPQEGRKTPRRVMRSELGALDVEQKRSTSWTLGATGSHRPGATRASPRLRRVEALSVPGGLGATSTTREDLCLTGAGAGAIEWRGSDGDPSFSAVPD